MTDRDVSMKPSTNGYKLTRISQKIANSKNPIHFRIIQTGKGGFNLLRNFDDSQEILVQSHKAVFGTELKSVKWIYRVQSQYRTPKIVLDHIVS